MELDATEEQLVAQAAARKKLRIEKAKQQGREGREGQLVPEAAVQKKKGKAAPKEEFEGVDGFYKIPGMTVDAPAITRIEGATLDDCLKSCKQGEHPGN